MTRLARLLPALALLAVACSPAEPAVTSTTTTLPEVTTSTAPEGSTTVPASTTTTSLPELVSLAYELVAELPFPVQLVTRPDDPVSYVVLKSGLILALDTATGETSEVLDISSRVRDSGEQGLLAMALHPTDRARAFVHYSSREGGRTVVSEFTFTSERQADPESERVIFEHAQPAGNHNGGMIAFTPDGTLLLGLGDGGGANDQFGHGQNPDTLLGGLVAIDVDGDAEPALYAMGLRNPWRFWIDEGLLYIGDVGQGQWEEVSVAPLQPEQNFGWSIMEGLHCFSPRSGCDQSGLVMPVIEVSHDDAGTCSITGGVVYRGAQIPEIDGHFFYSDYCGAYLRSFRFEDGSAVDVTDWTDQVGRTDGGVVGFGVDGQGEMYVASTRALYRVVAVRGG